MSFGRFYLNPRKVTVHPYTGEQIICEDRSCTEHLHFRARAYGGECEECQEPIVVCNICHGAISCCQCGNYHSIDCPWPL